VVFTHRLGQRQASVLAAGVVEVRLVKNSQLVSYFVTIQPHLQKGLERRIHSSRSDVDLDHEPTGRIGITFKKYRSVTMT
jgi:hypothetical protein